MGTEKTSGKLGFKKKFGYAIGQMVDSTGYNVYYFFFLFFLTDFAGIPAGIAGTISLIAIMWDAVTDPIVGNISDNLKSPYGRRRPLMIGATIPYAICTFLLFNNVDFGTNAKFAYFVVLAILFWSCYKTYVIPFFALGAELTDDFKERTSLRAWASVFLQIAVMIASAAPPMILEMAGKAGLQGAKGWNAVGVIFTFTGFPSFGVWLVFVSIFAFGNCAFWTLYYSMMYDISELDEFKNGTRREGIISALMSFFQKLGAAIATWVMGLLLSAGGYDGTAAVQSESALHMIKYLVTVLPAALAIIAALLAIAYPITGKRFDALLEALKLKREGKEYSTDGFKELL